MNRLAARHCDDRYLLAHHARRYSKAQAAAFGEASVDGSPSSPAVAWINVSTAFVWLVACWIAVSASDILFRPAALSLRGAAVVPPALRPSLATVRIGLALSGGGYRAALVQAGVLQELAALGIPITNIASVSGGSIIAAFVARGGDPAANPAIRMADAKPVFPDATGLPFYSTKWLLAMPSDLPPKQWTGLSCF